VSIRNTIVTKVVKNDCTNIISHIIFSPLNLVLDKKQYQISLRHFCTDEKSVNNSL